MRRTGVLLLCLGVALAWPLAVAAEGAEGQPPEEMLVVVQPAAEAYAGEGASASADAIWPTIALTDVLSQALEAVPGYRVQSWRSEEGEALTPEERAAELSRMADLGVAYLVEAQASVGESGLKGSVTVLRPPQQSEQKLPPEQGAEQALLVFLRSLATGVLRAAGVKEQVAQQALTSVPGSNNDQAVAHYYKGAAFWQLADGAGARAEYEAAVQADPNYAAALKALAGALYQEGVDAYSKGDSTAAVEKFEAAAQRYQQAGDEENAILSVAFAHLYQGEGLWSAGDKEAALEHFRAAVAESMKGKEGALLPKAHITYGGALWESAQNLISGGKNEEAVSALQQAAAQYGIAGQLRERAACLAAAAEVLEKLQRPAEAGEGYLEAGRLFVRVGEYESARKAEARVSVVAGEDATLRANALVLLALCDLRTTDLTPLKGLLEKGLTALRAGDAAQAQSTLEQARVLAQRAGADEVDVLLARALERMQQGEGERAAADLVDALSAVRDADNLNRARGRLEQAVALDDANVWAHKYLGDALLRQDNRAGAIEQYLRVQALQPQEAGPYADLGEAYLKSNLYSKAEETFLEGLKRVSPEDTDTAWRLQRGLGDVAIKLRKYAEARDAYQKALELFPFDVQSLIGLTVAYYDLKDLAEAERHAELAVTLSAANPELQKDANRLLDLIRKTREREEKLGKTDER